MTRIAKQTQLIGKLTGRGGRPSFDPTALGGMPDFGKYQQTPKPPGVEVTNNAKGEVFVDGEPVANFAARSCKACHGTGIFGTKVNRDGSRTRLVCPCVSKEIQKRAAG